MSDSWGLGLLFAFLYQKRMFHGKVWEIPGHWPKVALHDCSPTASFLFSSGAQQLRKQSVTIPVPIHLSLAPGTKLHDIILHIKKLQLPSLPLLFKLNSRPFHLSFPQSLLIRQLVTRQCYHFAPAGQKSPHTLASSHGQLTSCELTPIPAEQHLCFSSSNQIHLRKYTVRKSHFVISQKHRAVFQDWSFLQIQTVFPWRQIPFTKYVWPSFTHLSLKLQFI